MKSTRQSQEQKRQSKAQLIEWLRRGDTVYTILRHVSRSGMQRRISLVVFKGDRPFHLDWHVAQALGRPGANAGVIVNGAGMDMGYHLVDQLSVALGIELRHQWL